MKTRTNVHAPAPTAPQWRCRLPGDSRPRPVKPLPGRPITDFIDAIATVRLTHAPVAPWSLELHVAGTCVWFQVFEPGEGALRAEAGPSYLQPGRDPREPFSTGLLNVRDLC